MLSSTARLWYYYSWEDHELDQRPINHRRPILLHQYNVRQATPLVLKLVPKDCADASNKRIWELRAANAAELTAWVHMLTEQASDATAKQPAFA